MTKDLVKKVFCKRNKYSLPIAATFIKLIEVDKAKGKYKTEFSFLTYKKLGKLLEQHKIFLMIFSSESMLDDPTFFLQNSGVIQ